jgi:hypothetical protein
MFMANDYSCASISEIQKGMAALLRQKVKLYSNAGNNVTPQLVDAMLNKTPEAFTGLFDSLAGSGIMASFVIADGATVASFPKLLYLDSLVYEAERVSKNLGIAYQNLPDRLQFAAFLYRQIRRLPLREGSNVLYPDLSGQNPKDKTVDWALNYNDVGLAKILRCMIEDEDLISEDEQYIMARWKKNGWFKYMERRGGTTDFVINPLEESKEDFLIANFNSPDAIKLILSDLREFAENPYDLAEIMNLARKVLPRRKELAENFYYPEARILHTLVCIGIASFPP